MPHHVQSFALLASRVAEELSAVHKYPYSVVANVVPALRYDHKPRKGGVRRVDEVSKCSACFSMFFVWFFEYNCRNM